jgi:MFS family permease
MFKKFFDKLNISNKDFLVVFILLVNAFAWFYMAPMVIDGMIKGIGLADEQTIIMNGRAGSLYYVGIVISSLTGLILTKKINRLKFIYAWTIIGIVTSILPILVGNFTLTDCYTISFVFGCSFGLGIPPCLSYFADITVVENRGRISGIILLTANIAAPVLVFSSMGINLITNIIVLTGWRSLGLIVFFLKPNVKNSSTEIKFSGPLSGITKGKTFGFYLLAWILFCLVDRIAGPLSSYNLRNVSDSILILSPILASFTALIAGIMADWIGRKKIVLYGFVSLGVGYALIGISSQLLVEYFFVFINGITAGLLLVTFILVLWGDISQSGSREIYYTIGTLPLFLTEIMGSILDEYSLNIDQVTSFFSVAAFFLFLAVLPLLYAPETLPEKKMELMRLRKFAEDAKKAKEKYEKKIKC